MSFQTVPKHRSKKNRKQGRLAGHVRSRSAASSLSSCKAKSPQNSVPSGLAQTQEFTSAMVELQSKTKQLEATSKYAKDLQFAHQKLQLYVCQLEQMLAYQEQQLFLLQRERYTRALKTRAGCDRCAERSSINSETEYHFLGALNTSSAPFFSPRTSRDSHTVTPRASDTEAAAGWMGGVGLGADAQIAIAPNGRASISSDVTVASNDLEIRDELHVHQIQTQIEALAPPKEKTPTAADVELRDELQMQPLRTQNRSLSPLKEKLPHVILKEQKRHTVHNHGSKPNLLRVDSVKNTQILSKSAPSSRPGSPRTVSELEREDVAQRHLELASAINGNFILPGDTCVEQNSPTDSDQSTLQSHAEKKKKNQNTPPLLVGCGHGYPQGSSIPQTDVQHHGYPQGSSIPHTDMQHHGYPQVSIPQTDMQHLPSDTDANFGPYGIGFPDPLGQQIPAQKKVLPKSVSLKTDVFKSLIVSGDASNLVLGLSEMPTHASVDKGSRHFPRKRSSDPRFPSDFNANVKCPVAQTSTVYKDLRSVVQHLENLVDI